MIQSQTKVAGYYGDPAEIGYIRPEPELTCHFDLHFPTNVSLRYGLVTRPRQHPIPSVIPSSSIHHLLYILITHPFKTFTVPSIRLTLYYFHQLELVARIRRALAS
jgi:hypothetical protein